MEETKSSVGEEREQIRIHESRAKKEIDSLVLQVRELQVKLSTSRMREKDHVRKMDDMERVNIENHRRISEM